MIASTTFRSQNIFEQVLFGQIKLPRAFGYFVLNEVDETLSFRRKGVNRSFLAPHRGLAKPLALKAAHGLELPTRVFDENIAVDKALCSR